MLKPTISFDVEDLPPPSYYKRIVNDETAAFDEQSDAEDGDFVLEDNKGKVKTAEDIGASINKAEWWKAPEFVPRSFRQCVMGDKEQPSGSLFSHEASYSESIPPMVNPVQAQQPLGLGLRSAVRLNRAAPFLPVPIWAQGQQHQFMPPRFYPVRFNPTVGIKSPAGAVPPGYSANITTLNPGIGPPIPAIILKKKRKKKNRKSKDDFKDGDETTALLNGDEAEQLGNDAASRDQSLSKSEVDIITVPEQQHSSPSGNGALSNADTYSCPDLSEAQRSQLLLQDFISPAEHFHVQSSPVVQKALEELLLGSGDPEEPGAGGIRSERVKELDRQVLSEMQEQWKRQGKGRASSQQWLSSNDDDDDDFYQRLISDGNDLLTKDEDPFRGQPIRSVRQEIEEKTFLQHRPTTVMLNGADADGSTPRSTVVKYKAGCLVTEVNPDDSGESLVTKKLNVPFIPRATFVEDEIADDNGHVYVNTAEVDEIEFPNVRQMVYPYQAMQSSTNLKHTVVVQRRHSMSDATPPYFTMRSRACCSVM